MDEFQEFKKKLKIDDLKIFDSRHWSWSLRATQPTLGASIVSCKRNIETLSDLNKEESEDLGFILGKVQDALTNKLGCARVNVMLLMHFDNFVHFHMIPRYPQGMERFGERWEDSGWPGFPVGMLPNESIVPDDLRATILSYLRADC
jgi:diadenosine tetraphosphate (Ap4A) HIT family hydrolase